MAPCPSAVKRRFSLVSRCCRRRRRRLDDGVRVCALGVQRAGPVSPGRGQPRPAPRPAGAGAGPSVREGSGEGSGDAPAAGRTCGSRCLSPASEDRCFLRSRPFRSWRLSWTWCIAATRRRRPCRSSPACSITFSRTYAITGNGAPAGRTHAWESRSRGCVPWFSSGGQPLTLTLSSSHPRSAPTTRPASGRARSC